MPVAACEQAPVQRHQPHDEVCNIDGMHIGKIEHHWLKKLPQTHITQTQRNKRSGEHLEPKVSDLKRTNKYMS